MTGTPAVSQQSSGQRIGSVEEIRLDDDFRNLLANALIARHRAQIAAQPELLFLRATWDADGWARAQADELLAHIRTAMDNRSGAS